jgi:predicted nuclease of predicted toxin-antitoxin system
LSVALYLDEDVDLLLGVMLQRLGYDVLSTRDAGRRSSPDHGQLEFAAEQGRTIFTHNRKDYYDLAIQWAAAGREHQGIIVATRAPPQVLRDRVVRLLAAYPDGLFNQYIDLPR